MQCNEIQNHFADYVKETLEPAIQAELARHLRECEACNAELDALTEAWVRLGSLPSPEPASPDMDIRFRLALESEKRSAEQGKGPGSAWTTLRVRRPALAFALAGVFAVLFVVVLVGELSLRRSRPDVPSMQAETSHRAPEVGRSVTRDIAEDARLRAEAPIESSPRRSVVEGPAWQVKNVRGTPRVESSAIADEGRLRVGEVLHTDASSEARVKIADIGELHVDPNTIIRLLVTGSDQHRMVLERGKIAARTWSPPRLFVVETPTATAVDLGCRYTLEVEEDGGSLLHVVSGIVALQTHNLETVVPAGAMCRTRPKTGTGSPFFENATEAFRSALDRLDFGRDPRDRAPQLVVVLAESRPRDAMTLWNLMPRLEAPLRGIVYDRLAQFAPPPAGVTRDRIITLDSQALDLWKDRVSKLWQPVGGRNRKPKTIPLQ